MVIYFFVLFLKNVNGFDFIFIEVIFLYVLILNFLSVFDLWLSVYMYLLFFVIFIGINGVCKECIIFLFCKEYINIFLFIWFLLLCLLIYIFFLLGLIVVFVDVGGIIKDWIIFFFFVLIVVSFVL